MSKLIAAIALCLIILFSNLALADGSVSQTGLSMGGAAGWNPILAIVRQYNASGERFRIDSYCQSACTMFLGIRNVCVTRSAELAFHGAWTHTREPTFIEGATNRMIAAYNPRLRSYLQAGGYMSARSLHTISGQDMITKFGYRACP